MKTILYILTVFLPLFTACTPDKFDIREPDFNPEAIQVLKMKTDSRILYADGVSVLKLDYEAFTIVQQDLKKMVVNADNDTLTENYTQTDTVKLAKTRIPEGTIRFFKEDGGEIPGGAYKPANGETGSLKVYAKLGGLKSDLFEIEVRQPFPTEEKVIFPVIFHVVQSASQPVLEVSSAYLEKKLARLNDVFGRKNSVSSNGGNANIEFRLASFNAQGKELEEKGINRIATTTSSFNLLPVLAKNTWNTKQYLNVWICSYAYDSYYDKKTFSLLSSVAAADRLPGLNFTEIIDAETPPSLSDPYRTGIVIGTRSSLIATSDLFNFNWENNFGTYLGLLSTNTSYAKDDFCPDTYAYSNQTMSQGSYSKKSMDGYEYNSENIMDDPSRRSVISAAQVQRIRWIIKNSPSRWAYKSDFAFTGKP